SSRWLAQGPAPGHSRTRKTSPTTNTDRNSLRSRIRHTTDSRNPSGNRSSDENRQSESALRQNGLYERKDENPVRRAFRRRRGCPKFLQWTVQWQYRDRRL